MDHTQAPVLEALRRHHERGELAFTPPGHKQARGADPRARAILGDAVYHTDLLASGGLDDRRTRGDVLLRAERLMADAVHAEHTYFTTCGSSLSVKAAMLAVAGPNEKLIVGRDAHKSVISGLIFSGIEPGLLDDALRLAADVRRAIDEIPGLHVLDRDDLVGPGLSRDFDPLPMVIDVSGLGTSGYRAADWLRTRHRIDVHLADHRRINAQLTHADSTATTQPLIDALRDLAGHAGELAAGQPVIDVPSGQELRLEQACRPRDAYFRPSEAVPLERAAGRVAAEMITPYPPGIPAVLPGERLTEPALRYLRTGLRGGMNLPDASDPELATIRVVA